MFVAALLRDAKGDAKAGLPLTIVVKRPDGVEYKRASVADQGLGGRALAVPLVAGAAPGTWSIDAYRRSEGAGDRPRRIPGGGLCARAARFRAEDASDSRDAAASRSTSRSTRKFLYGAPASGLDITGAIRLQAVDGSELAGYPGYVARH